MRRWVLITALAGLTLPGIVEARVADLTGTTGDSHEAATATTTTTAPPAAVAPTTPTTEVDASWLEAVVEPPAPDGPGPQELVRALPDDAAPAAPVAAPAPLEAATVASSPISSSKLIVPAHREQYRPILIRYAQANGLPADLVMALAWKESSWRPGAASGAGATGIMQLMPTTVEFASKNLMGLKTPLDPLNPTSNIRMATRFLRHLVDHFDGDFRSALIAYNQGITSLKRRGAYAQASSFAETVLRLRASFPAPRVLK